MTTLARSRAAGDRDRLFQALAILCAQAGMEQRPETRALLTDLLTTLLAQADPDQRARFADGLASAPWTPPAVARQLAREPLGEAALTALVSRAEADPGLRAALGRHPGLTRALAEALAPRVSEPLRHELEARFGLQPGLRGAAGPDAPQQIALVGKLHAAGRLGPGTLLGFLRTGRTAAFRAGLAALSGADSDTVGEACSAQDPAALEQLCSRAGLDRAVLPEALARAGTEG